MQIDYEELKKLGYSPEQINQIEKAAENNLNLLECVTPEITIQDMRLIRSILNLYKNNEESLKLLYATFKEGLLLPELNDSFYKLNPWALDLYIYATKNEYPASKYYGNTFNKGQAKEIKRGIDKRIPANLFYNNKYTGKEIKFIIDNVDNSNFKNMYFRHYKLQSIIKLLKYPELIEYSNESISPDMVDAYKILYDYLKKVDRLDEFNSFTDGLRKPNQLKIVVSAMKENLDYKQLSYAFNPNQMRVILTGLYNGINVDVYKNRGYTAEQMDMIRILQTKIEKKEKFKDCDINIIRNDEMNPKEMKERIDLYDIFTYYKDKFDINKIFLNNSVKDIENILEKLIKKDEKDLQSICDMYGIENAEIER